VSSAYVVTPTAGEPVRVEIRGDALTGAGVQVSVDGREYVIDAERLPDGSWSLIHEGRQVLASPATMSAAVVDARRAALRGAAGAGATGPRSITSPMPGRVVAVLVAEGEVVEEGTGLVVVEAMKMENVLPARGAGTVSAVRVAVGDAVEAGQELVVVA
jgi:biotin carboxyl carrier protein